MSASDTLKRIDAALAALRTDKTITDSEAERKYASLQHERKGALAVRAREQELADRYEPHYYLVNCKACKTGTRVKLTLDREAERWNRLDRWADDQGARYSTNKGDYRPIVPCRKCGKRYFGKEVVGVYNPDIECNAKCQSAKGPNCECKCKGLNHGKAWGG